MNIKFNPSQSDAMNFWLIEEKIVNIANEKGLKVTQIIDKFMLEIKENPELIKTQKIGNVNEVVNKLKEYLLKMRKRYAKKEREEAKKVQEELDMQKYDRIWEQIIEEQIKIDVSSGEKGTEIEIIKKLKCDIKKIALTYNLDKKGEKGILKRMDARIKYIEDVERKAKEAKEKEAGKEAMRKAKEEERKAIEEEARKDAEEKAKEEKPQISEKSIKAMKQIKKIMEREVNEGNIPSRLKYLRSVRNIIIGEDEQAIFKVNIDGKEKDELLEVLDAEIKNESYFEQVQKFTNNFRFLVENADIVSATGMRTGIKFNIEEGKRFDLLKEILETKMKKVSDKKLRYNSKIKHKDDNEYRAIEELLEQRDKMSEIDIRILTARKEVIEKEIEVKSKRGEIVR